MPRCYTQITLADRHQALSAFVTERNCLGGLGAATDKFIDGVPVLATFGEIPLGAFAFIGERITVQPGRPSTPQAVVTG
jgi:hypothetical protein